MELKIYDNSKNYVCQVVKLSVLHKIEGLDNLVKVNIQGNDCLVGKDTNIDELHLFFPAECQISKEFLSVNNLFRHSELNKDKTKQGFFEDSGRVKCLKFKGVISSGFIIPVNSLRNLFELMVPIGVLKLHSSFKTVESNLKVGDEFNEICGIEICKKYIKQRDKVKGMSNPRVKTIDNIVDSRMAPEHFSTEHLMKNCHKLNLDDYIAVTYKLHGTSARYFNTLVKKPLSIRDKIAKFFGVNVVKEHYDYICASRKVIKSCGFEELPDKNHYYQDGDLWSKVGKEFFEGKLNHGECVYTEIVGCTYNGSFIQHGYSYGFTKPKVYIYRISNINSQGIEIDLSYLQMKERVKQLDVEVCPELFYGTLGSFIQRYRSIDKYNDVGIGETLNNLFYNILLEKPSILDSTCIEEGFCLRVDKYGKPDIYKIKSKKFLLHEGALMDKQDVVDIEEEQTV